MTGKPFEHPHIAACFVEISEELVQFTIPPYSIISNWEVLT